MILCYFEVIIDLCAVAEHLTRIVVILQILLAVLTADVRTLSVTPQCFPAWLPSALYKHATTGRRKSEILSENCIV